jgi:thioredoxin 1
MAKILEKLFRGGVESDLNEDPANDAGPIHITDNDFQSQVLESDLPVIVDFWAPWCMPCRMIAPVLDRLAKDYKGQLLVAKVNTDENPEWAIKYGVQGIPTLLFVKDGQIVNRIVGVAPAGQIKKHLEQLL